MKERRIEWYRCHMKVAKGKENQKAPFALPSNCRLTYCDGSASNET
jgi:hypothetical protein